MLKYEDVVAIENGEVEPDAYYDAVQRAINSGQAWSLQGSFGRTMMGAIDSGHCLLGKTSARDYYGNWIPSRFDVKPGTKGSFDFVASNMGDEWAAHMAELD